MIDMAYLYAYNFYKTKKKKKYVYGFKNFYCFLVHLFFFRFIFTKTFDKLDLGPYECWKCRVASCWQ